MNMHALCEYAMHNIDDVLIYTVSGKRVYRRPYRIHGIISLNIDRFSKFEVVYSDVFEVR